jgi:hypothetical protein
MVGTKTGAVEVYSSVSSAQVEKVATIPIPDSLEAGQSFSGTVHRVNMQFALTSFLVYAMQFVGDWRDAPLNLLLVGYKRTEDGRPEQILCFQLEKQQYQVVHSFSKFPVVADPEMAPTFRTVSIPEWYVVFFTCCHYVGHVPKHLD